MLSAVHVTRNSRASRRAPACNEVARRGRRAMRSMWHQGVVLMLAIASACTNDARRLATAAEKPTLESLTQQAPAATISARDLWVRFSVQRPEAEREFVGRIVAIHGTARTVNTNPDRPFVNFDVGEMSSGGVQAVFAATQREDVAKITPGSRVAVKCFCVGKFVVVSLTPCVVLP